MTKETELTAIAVWTVDPVSGSSHLEGIAPNMKTAKFHMTMILGEYANNFLDGMNFDTRRIKHPRKIAALQSEEYRSLVRSLDYQVLQVGSIYADIAFETWASQGHSLDDLADVQPFYDAHKAEKESES